jgi:hypothetical protein
MTTVKPKKAKMNRKRSTSTGMNQYMFIMSHTAEQTDFCMLLTEKYANTRVGSSASCVMESLILATQAGFWRRSLATFVATVATFVASRHKGRDADSLIFGAVK